VADSPWAMRERDAQRLCLRPLDLQQVLSRIERTGGPELLRRHRNPIDAHGARSDANVRERAMGVGGLGTLVALMV
jgi:hypothetical protein